MRRRVPSLDLRWSVLRVEGGCWGCLAQSFGRTGQRASADGSVLAHLAHLRAVGNRFVIPR
jgi:hypothetical protein